MARTTVDVLLVSPGTTTGWRRIDSHALETLRAAGLSVAVAATDFRIARHLRRTMALTDLAEAAAMRRATTRALRTHEPRAILFSGVQSVLLQPRARLRIGAVRFDSLTSENRPGRANSVQHLLERRALRRMGALLPAGLGRQAPRSGVPVVALPFPVTVPAAIAASRDPLVVAYAGNPDKKGLDVIVQAWAAAAASAHRLVVTGIAPQAAREFLRKRGVTEPAKIDWAGTLEPAEHVALVARAAAYLSASRFEDYGIAQLEALAHGTPLVTTQSPGRYEALPLARQLESALVAREASPQALATALRAALEMPDAAQDAYADRARELVAPYSEAEVRRRLTEDVIPLLLR